MTTRHDAEKLLRKLEDGSTWLMQKTVLRHAVRAEAISSPLKVIVDLRQTEFLRHPLFSEEPSLAVMPPLTCEQALDIRETLHYGRYFDISGVLESGTIRRRDASGCRFAVFGLAQSEMPTGRFAVSRPFALEISVKEPLCNKLVRMSGQSVALFRLNARLVEDRVFVIACPETFVARLPPQAGALPLSIPSTGATTTATYTEVAKAGSNMEPQKKRARTEHSQAIESSLSTDLWETQFERFHNDEKMRAQVSAALRLLSGAARTQMEMTSIFNRPGASVLRGIFEEAFHEQKLDMLSAQEMLIVLDEFASRAWSNQLDMGRE